MKKKGGFALRYGISGAIGLALGLWIARLRGFALGGFAYLNARYLSDGFFVSGLVFAGFGALVWVSTSTDFFDIFRYGMKSLLVLFTPLKKPSEHPSFWEYKEERAAKRTKRSCFLLIVGAVLLSISVLCLALYYRLPQ